MEDIALIKDIRTLQTLDLHGCMDLRLIKNTQLMVIYDQLAELPELTKLCIDLPAAGVDGQKVQRRLSKLKKLCTWRCDDARLTEIQTGGGCMV